MLVNLTPLVEGGRLKSHQYWPDEKGMVLKNGWKVTTQSERKIDLEDGKATLVRRVIHIDTLSDSGWGVTQFHLTSWPDHGVFPTTLLLQLMKETQQVAMPKIYPPPPMWVHCSAGVGRSGTLIAALIAEATINVTRHSGGEEVGGDDVVGRNAKAEMWDLPVRIVEHMRRYRARMVQTIDQFEALYDIVNKLAGDAGLLKH